MIVCRGAEYMPPFRALIELRGDQDFTGGIGARGRTGKQHVPNSDY